MPVQLYDLTLVPRRAGLGGVTLRPRWPARTCRTLRTGVTLRPRLPLWSGGSGGPWRTCIAPWAIRSSQSRNAVRSWRAARPRAAVRSRRPVLAIASVPPVGAVLTGGPVAAPWADDGRAAQVPYLL